MVIHGSKMNCDETRQTMCSYDLTALSELPQPTLYPTFTVPKEYHNFADVFSKAKVSVLTLHQEYNLKIELEEGANLPPGRLYSLSPVELNTL